MNETLGQLFETLSTLEPTITGGFALAALSVGYFVYHVKKNKKSTADDDNEVSEKEASKDVNEITMETKYFNVDDSQETTEVTTFKDLDNFSPKPNLTTFNTENDTDNSEIENTNNSASLDQESVLDNYSNNSVGFINDFIEESNKDLNKISNKETDSNNKPKLEQFAIDDKNLEQLSTITLETPNLEKEEALSQDLRLNPQNEVIKNEEEQSNVLLFNNTSNPNKINNTESNELLVFALEADHDNNKKDALTYLQQAIQTEADLTDRVRLKIIFQTYENADRPLAKILDEIPSLKQVQELPKSEAKSIRFVNVDDLKFNTDEDYGSEPNSNDAQINITHNQNNIEQENFDVSSLLAIPQVEEEVRVDDNIALTGEEINNKVADAIKNIPSLSDVTFTNVDAPNLDTKDHLENFLETLAVDIEKDNLQVAIQSVEDSLLTEKLLEEVKLKEIENEQHLNNPTVSLDETLPSNKLLEEISLEKNIIEAKDNITEENNHQLSSLSSLNFKEVSNVSKVDINEQITTKVWVNLIINNGNNGEQILVNKKFQINGEFGSIEGNTSLNRQVNTWVKHTYNTTSYVVTLLLPIQ